MPSHTWLYPACKVRPLACKVNFFFAELTSGPHSSGNLSILCSKFFYPNDSLLQIHVLEPFAKNLKCLNEGTDLKAGLSTFST